MNVSHFCLVKKYFLNCMAVNKEEICFKVSSALCVVIGFVYAHSTHFLQILLNIASETKNGFHINLRLIKITPDTLFCCCSLKKLKAEAKSR